MKLRQPASASPSGRNTSQLQLSLGGTNVGPPSIFRTAQRVNTTPVYESFWDFAAERQAIFFRRIRDRNPPWTDDPILSRYKFTNVYRASDRVSQYLIRHVIYKGDQSTEEVFFRTALFRFFNKIETWEWLLSRFGEISSREFTLARYDAVLTDALASGKRIYSAAYIMPSGVSSFGHRRKHRNHLELLGILMRDEVPKFVSSAPSMKHVFEILCSYPMIGKFLGYQLATDLNYSRICDFSEVEFVMPGPGAMDGIHKCFSHLGGLNEPEIIRLMTDRQEQEFERLGLEFRTLWGRAMQLIDVQNVFCEVSKYSRVKHPEITGVDGRTRIKQIYRPSLAPLQYWFPPKWGINRFVSKRIDYALRSDTQSRRRDAPHGP